MLSWLEIVALAAGPAVGVYLGFGWLVWRSRRLCPRCGVKGLRRDIGRCALVRIVGERGPYCVSDCIYVCERCDAEFGERDKQGLVPKAAWDAGAREPLPTATANPRMP